MDIKVRTAIHYIYAGKMFGFNKGSHSSVTSNTRFKRKIRVQHGQVWTKMQWTHVRIKGLKDQLPNSETRLFQTTLDSMCLRNFDLWVARLVRIKIERTSQNEGNNTRKLNSASKQLSGSCGLVTRYFFPWVKQSAPRTKRIANNVSLSMETITN